jgi:hypothetical protein
MVEPPSPFEKSLDPPLKMTSVTSQFFKKIYVANKVAN